MSDGEGGTQPRVFRFPGQSGETGKRVSWRLSFAYEHVVPGIAAFLNAFNDGSSPFHCVLQSDLSNIQIMADTLHPQLKSLCKQLDELAKAVESGWTDDRPLMENWGWNFTALTRHSLARAARDIASEVRSVGAAIVSDSLLPILNEWIVTLRKIQAQQVQYFYNGHGHQAVPMYLDALGLLRFELRSVLGWQPIHDTNLLPPKLARRLRSYQAELDQIAPKKDELTRQLALITDAASAADALPTDMEALAHARKATEDIQSKSALMRENIAGHLATAEESAARVCALEKDAAKLVAQMR